MWCIPERFNARKLKNTLKLATHRFELLSNKRSAKMETTRRELRKEMAKLSIDQDVSNASSDDVTVRRVRLKAETLLRHQDMVAVLDVLIDICEMLVGHMKIIETARGRNGCGPTIRTAVATLIFATIRLPEDIPEMFTLQTQFRRKFGSKFVRTCMDNSKGLVRDVVVQKIKCAPPTNDAIVAFLKSNTVVAKPQSKMVKKFVPINKPATNVNSKPKAQYIPEMLSLQDIATAFSKLESLEKKQSPSNPSNISNNANSKPNTHREDKRNGSRMRPLQDSTRINIAPSAALRSRNNNSANKNWVPPPPMNPSYSGRNENLIPANSMSKRFASSTHDPSKNPSKQATSTMPSMEKFVSENPNKWIEVDRNFGILYDSRSKIPLFVIELQDGTHTKPGKRPKDFHEHRGIEKQFRSNKMDYKRSGYDRGHMKAAADCDQDMINASFNLCNVSPQNSKMNRGIWSQLERWCRNTINQWKKDNGSVSACIMTGPLLIPESVDGKDTERLLTITTIGDGRVYVPTHHFKVVVIVENEMIVAFACFVVPNKEPDPSKNRVEDYLVHWTDLEDIAGFRLFPYFASIKGFKEAADGACQDQIIQNPFITSPLLPRRTPKKLDSYFDYEVQHLCALYPDRQ